MIKRNTVKAAFSCLLCFIISSYLIAFCLLPRTYVSAATTPIASAMDSTLSDAAAKSVSAATHSLVTVPAEVPSGYPMPPEIESGSCILMDADSGTILYEKNMDEQCYPASITKLMTALIAVENCNLSNTLTVTSNAVASIKYGDATAVLKTDEEFTVEQALYVMLIKSANDMAYALGEYTGGTIANFAAMMNKKAAELGCTGTHFANASGLTDVNHYTTAHDMALIARAVIDVPVIMDAISYTTIYSVPPTNKTNETRYYKLSHSMVTGSYKYQYCIGGKTGYTDAAGHTLATFAEKDGLRLICIVLKSTDEARYRDTIALFEYAFENFHRVNISENEDSFSFNQGLGLSVFGINGKAIKGDGRLSLTVPAGDYLLIPNGVRFSDLSRDISYNRDSNVNGFATISYRLKERLIGTTRLIIPESFGDTVTDFLGGLPYLPDIGSGNISTQDILVPCEYQAVNLWLFIGGICIVVIIITVGIYMKKNRHKLRFD